MSKSKERWLGTKRPECRRCPYATHQYVPPSGKLNAPVMFIGESPGVNEAAKGEVFIGRSGQLLNEFFEESGLKREDVYITNAIKCHPAVDQKLYDPSAIEMCRRMFLDKEIARVKPRLIVPMGNWALQALTRKSGITRARGVVTEQSFYPVGTDLNTRTKEADAIRESVRLCATKVLPTFHPAYILRNPSYREFSVADFKQIRTQAKSAKVIKPKTRDVDYRAFRSLGEAKHYIRVCLSDQVKRLSWDIETTSLDYREAEVLCFSFSSKNREARALHFFYDYPQGNDWAYDPKLLMLLYKLLTSGKIIYFQNGKYDIRVMRYFLRNLLKKSLSVHRIGWRDTMCMHALLDENKPHNLKDMSRLNTDIIYTEEELQTVKAGLIVKAPLSQRTLYACKDADATRRLGIKFEKQLKREGLWHLYDGYDYSDAAVLKTLFDMETFGTPVDLNELSDVEKAISDKLYALERSLQDIARQNLNVRSVPQLQEVMFYDLQITPSGRLTGAGKPSTDAEALDIIIERDGHEFAKNLKLFRQYDKIQGTFVNGIRNALDHRGRIQADFVVSRAVTGRIVCQNPNLVNIPRDKEFEEGLLISIRRVFKARPGWVIVAGDWSQIEFKIAAILAGDGQLIHDIFVEGGDVHTLAAQAMYPGFIGTQKKLEKLRGMVQDLPQEKIEKATRRLSQWEMQLKDWRTDAKRWNFGTLYGGSDQGIAEQMNMDIEEMHKYAERMRERYPDLANYIRVMPIIAREEQGVDSSFGRKRRLPLVYDKLLQARQGRQAINHGPQTDAAYVGRGALVRICQEAKRRKLRGFPFNLVYDSVLVECPEEEAPIFVEIMTENMLQSIPELGDYTFSIEMGVGKSWREAEQHAVEVKSKDDAPKVLVLSSGK